MPDDIWKLISLFPRPTPSQREIVVCSAENTSKMKDARQYDCTRNECATSIFVLNCCKSPPEEE